MMAFSARIVVGVDGTDWGFEALPQALALATAEDSCVEAVTALHTSPTARTGFDAAHWVDVLTTEAAEAHDAAATNVPQQSCRACGIAAG